MENFKEDLRKVMCKISNYVHWQENEVNEDDFRILNQATGFDLAEVAYNNRIHISRFIKNSKLLIDEYNEKVLINRINDITVIKRSLQSPFALKYEKPKEAKDYVIRRQASELFDVNAEMLKRGLITESQHKEREQLQEEGNIEKPVEPTAQTFASRIENERSQMPSISLHRAALPSYSRVLPNLTAQEQRTNLHADLNLMEDFGELNNEDIARLGLFEGDIGEKLYHSLNARKTLGQVSEMPLPEIEIPEIPDLPRIELEQPALEAGGEIRQIEQQQISDATHEVSKQPENSIKQSQIRESDIFTKRYEDFRIAVEQAHQLYERNKPRRQRRNLKVTPSESDDEESNNVLKFFEKRTSKTIKKLPKRQRALLITSLKPFNHMDVFYEIQIFKENFLPFESEDENQHEEESIQFPMRESTEYTFRKEIENKQSSTPIATTILAKRIITSPPNIEPSAKRVCTDIEMTEKRQEVQVSIAPQPEIEAFVNPPEADIQLIPTSMMQEVLMPTIEEEIPLQIPKPKKSTSVLKDLHVSLESFGNSVMRLEQSKKHQSKNISRQQLTTDDAILDLHAVQSHLEAEKLASELNIVETVPQEPQSILQDILIPEIIPEIISRQTQKSKKKSLNIERKIILKDGIEYYETYNRETGITKIENKYQIDIFMLYLQIRLLMKKHCANNRWKMNVKELILDHKIQIGEHTDDLSIITGLIKLVQMGYLIAYWVDTNEGEKLSAVEIKLDRPQSAAESL
ncbi:hypothetical protein PVAND_001125 [Polypedilum vanderplanki]|uniref:Uncharacterized protein n=1 Tax=Polypedilum vanderplanki TaxID=319348 RepID=A0A9J6BNA5_POLVA|nr:hypothetical protein PVAND_001125 [Polypedilum vanderplanki]